jgi:cytoskeletal protein RodZ
MAEDEDPLERRSDKPMYGERRPLAPALLGVLAMVVVVVGIVALLTWLRYTT